MLGMGGDGKGPAQATPSAHTTWDILDTITSGSADGITIQDPSGALVYANDAAARMTGFASGAELLDATPGAIVDRFEIFDEEGAALPIDRLPGRRALRGELEPEAVIRFRSRTDGVERWALVRATPVLGAENTVQLVVNVFIDVTERRNRDQVQRFLADASKELVTSLDWEVTLQRVAELAVPVLADWCAVDVLQPDGSLELIAVAHVEPEKATWAYELRRRFPVDPGAPTGVANVVRTGIPEMIPEITQEMIDAADIRDPELLDVIERLQLSSVMYVPLIARGRMIGALEFVWAESGRHYTEEDLGVAQDLAARAALALDNARLYGERVRVSLSLQERLLPRSLPDIPGLRLVARYLPAAGERAGGDFYDVFEMDDGSWKAVIGDVCGKGPEAAALMGFVRFTMRAVSRQDTFPSEALVKVNRALREEIGGDSAEFCTAAVVRLTPAEGGEIRLILSVAGHPLPRVIRASGDVEELGTHGNLLGIFDEISAAVSAPPFPPDRATHRMA
jgi:PAS domain S-box-containing protein